MYSIYVSFQMCTFPSTYLCDDLGRGGFGKMTGGGEKSIPALGPPWEPQSSLPGGTSVFPHHTHAHPRCTSRAQKCHPRDSGLPRPCPAWARPVTQSKLMTQGTLTASGGFPRLWRFRGRRRGLQWFTDLALDRTLSWSHHNQPLPPRVSCTGTLGHLGGWPA